MTLQLQIYQQSSFFRLSKSRNVYISEVLESEARASPRDLVLFIQQREWQTKFAFDIVDIDYTDVEMSKNNVDSDCAMKHTTDDVITGVP